MRTNLWKAAAALAVAALVGCSETKPTAPAEKVHGVAVMQVQKTSIPEVVEATGTVRAALSAQLSSQVIGTITRVNVHEGDRVRRGEVLVAIDESKQQAAFAGANAGLRASQESIAAADADYALAESTLKRYQMLYDKKSVSPQEFDEIKARLAAAKARRDTAHAGREQAEAGVSQAGTAVSFTKVRDPFDGRAIAIPKSAVLNRGQLQAVYVVGSDQLASLRYVTLGPASSDQVEVLSGLQSGDRIVVQSGDRDLSGKQVEGQ